jgi:hypothetical protein
MKLISIFSSSSKGHTGLTFSKLPRQNGRRLTDLSSSIRRVILVTPPPGRDVADVPIEHAPSRGHVGRPIPQSSLLKVQAPAHRHPSMFDRLVKKIHSQVAPSTTPETRSLAGFVIRKSPARIRGLAMERLARMAGEIEKCPVCPEECPVPERPVRVIGRSDTNRGPGVFAPKRIGGMTPQRQGALSR